MGVRPAYLTFDLEPDCLPYLRGNRGMHEGFPLLMALLAEEGVRATFFTTGETAERFPDSVRSLVDADHELGCHGMTHGRFTTMTRTQAATEIRDASAILRRFAEVTSFRAPYLSYPGEHLDLLRDAGYHMDSSQARYKMWRERGASAAIDGLTRMPASVPPSLLRLRQPFWAPFLRHATAPLVLFAHPWEFVDMTNAPIPWDCRFNTGTTALVRLREVIRYIKATGSSFALMRDASALQETTS